MPGNVNAHPAQLLNQSPNFRAARRNLFGNLRAADHNRGVLHQQTYDVPEPEIRRLLLKRRIGPYGGFPCQLLLTSWMRLADAGIIGESSSKDKSSAAKLNTGIGTLLRGFCKCHLRMTKRVLALCRHVYSSCGRRERQRHRRFPSRICGDNPVRERSSSGGEEYRGA